MSWLRGKEQLQRLSESPLGSRPFRLLFIAQVVSRTGDAFTTVALPFAVLGLTGSVADVGIVLAAKTLPLVLFVLLGGVWADRAPRRSVPLVGSGVVRFMSQAVFALLLITGKAHLWQLIVLMAVHGTAAAMYYPAISGVVPQTVARADLQKANAMLSLTRSSSVIFGPALAGILVASAGPGWAIAIDSLSFAASTLLFLAMRLPGTVVLAEGGALAQFRDGWREVRSRTWVWATITGFGAFQFAGQGSIYVLGPSIAEHRLGGASVWGLLLTTAGLGSLAGDFAALRFRPRLLIVGTMCGVVLSIPALASLAAAAPPVLIAMAFFVYGAGMSFADTLWYTALQEQIPAAALSRVSSYDWMGSVAFQPLGQAVMGPLAIVIGTTTVISGAAALIAVTSILVLCSPTVRRLRRLATVRTHDEAQFDVPVEGG
jgi:MFS family permease